MCMDGHDEEAERYADVVDAPEAAIAEALKLVDEHYGGKPAWITGSRVDGDPGPGSDLDVVVETVPTHRKHSGGEPLDQGHGAGRLFEDTGCGVVIDITEDEDGPIWRGRGSQVRVR